MKYPDGISIILCCHNSSQLLPETLNHLAKLIKPSDVLMELVVVDNASTDGTAEVAQKLWGQYDAPFPARVLHEEKKGLIYARQLGLKESSYEYILFVDDDNHLHNDYALEMESIFSSHPLVAAAGGLNTPVFQSEKPAWYSKFQHSFATGNLGDGFGEPWEIGLFGAGLCLRRSALNDLYSKGFNSKLVGRQGKSLSSGEDYELCKALKIAGREIVYAPNLRLGHLILPQRLQWDYFRKLNIGISRSIIYFLAYEYWIEQSEKGKSFTTDVKFAWPFMLIRKWLKVILLKIKLLYTAGSENEGSELLINYERALTVAVDFWRKRRDYISLKHEIGNAAWRKRH